MGIKKSILCSLWDLELTRLWEVLHIQCSLLLCSNTMSYANPTIQKTLIEHLTVKDVYEEV